MIRFWLLALLSAQVLLVGGCATSKVWQAGQFARFHEPAIPSKVLLFDSSQRGDVLVEYDEWRDGDEKIRRRAYLLEQNTGRLEAHRNQRFVTARHDAELSPIATIEA